MDAERQRRALEADGYCVLPDILSSRRLVRARQATAELLAAPDPAHFADRKATGSLISVFPHAYCAALAAWPPALAALAALGCAAPKFTSGYVIRKPPPSPPRCWRQDGGGWDAPLSYAAPALPFFLMHYRVDAEPANGCLRVLRGSHRRRHAMRDLAPEAHAEALRRASDPAHPALRSLPEDAAAPVRAGDAVLTARRNGPPPRRPKRSL